MGVSHIKPLFGGELSWKQDDWTASDDRVRGGKSQSYLRINHDQAVFEGELDTETLGGAGFCSQRTTGDDYKWDLSSFDGIELTCDVSHSDDKRYTFIVKDEILPKSPDGREQSTVSWEFDFIIQEMVTSGQAADLRSLQIPWDEFKATYRGRPTSDAGMLNLKSIKRMSIMMRSFFDSQSGAFQLSIESINAYKEAAEESGSIEKSSTYSMTKPGWAVGDGETTSWADWICCIARR